MIRIPATRWSIFLICLTLVPGALRSQVRTGIEILQERDFDLLKGQRVGLVTNPTGVDRQLRSTVDILHDHVRLAALFGPEHGVRGDYKAGDRVGDRVDEKTGVPVFSLYGQNRKPGRDALELVDVIVYDIQDIGIRSYTYISTLGLVMEAAAEAGKRVVVLDRPNPLGGERIEGPLVEPEFRSFVSRYEIPYLYGLTCGELARFLNEEGMLEGGKRCHLEVVPMEGWKREMVFEETGLPWVPTSPHIPHNKTPLFTAATGILGELDPNTTGIGYTLPFQTLVTRTMDADALSDEMNALGLEGVRFRPIRFRPYYMAGKGDLYQGVQIHLIQPGQVGLTEIQFWFMHVARRIDPGFDPFTGREGRWEMFDRVCGSDSLRISMTRDYDFSRVRPYWKGDPEAFRKRVKPYLLYR